MLLRLLAVWLMWLSAAAWPLGAAMQPAEEAGAIATMIVRLFEHAHFGHQKLDKEVAARFLKKYIEGLDYNHLFFLQSDVREFDRYAARLDEMTRAGNVTPAYEIFARYSRRVEEAVAKMKEFMTQPLDFNTSETIALDRTKAPWPADEAEQEMLLRRQVKYEMLEQELSKEKPEEARKTLTRRYDRLLRSLREMDSRDVLDAYLNALAHAYDPHSDYLGPADLKNFEIGLKLSLCGIGAVLQSQDGYAKIVSLIPGGPADLDKRLKPNDRIVEVAEGEQPWVDVVDMKLSKVVELIRGAKGTTVRLKIIPADAPDSSVRKVVTLIRNEVKLTEQRAKAKIIEWPGNTSAHAARSSPGGAQFVTPPRRLGVIELPSFYADTDKLRAGDANPTSSSRDVAALLEKLKAERVDGVVLDLRRNGGGLLEEAVAVAGLFIEEGPIVQVKDLRHHIQVLRDEDANVVYSGPLVVLVSHVSASASEILAAAIQDYNRGLVVGDSKTFGKGTVQTMVALGSVLPDLPNSGALKLTTQKFYRVEGGSTQNHGVIPDIVLPSILDARNIGESTLDNALPYDEVKPVRHKDFGPPIAQLPELKRLSSERVARDRDFAYLKEDIARVAARVKQGTISLNKAERLREKKENDDRDAARKQERKARKTPEPKATEITLQSDDGSPRTATTQTSVPPPTHDPADEDDAAEKNGKETGFDPALRESLAILNDFINLSPPVAHATASTGASPATRAP
ncbi:MAG: carboxy terminal-processing peptidase [Verrucomicrobiae bacterium]|nr:carboxy terminal-processing peptidase [Verrucomicrobiae bacterium]